MFQQFVVPAIDLNSLTFLHPNKPVIQKLVEKIKVQQYFTVGEWLQDTSDEDLFYLGQSMLVIRENKGADIEFLDNANFVLDMLMLLLLAEGGELDTNPVKYFPQLIKIFNTEVCNRTGLKKLKWYDRKKVSLVDADSVFCEFV